MIACMARLIPRYDGGRRKLGLYLGQLQGVARKLVCVVHTLRIGASLLVDA